MAKTFLLEIGTEEMPSSAIEAATKQGVTFLEKALLDAGLDHGEVELITTPRRLAFLVSNLAEKTQAKRAVYTGPAKEIAYASDGSLTKAGAGFLRSKGVDEIDAYIDDTGHLSAVIESPAVSATTLLPAIAKNLIASLSFARTQRWGSEHVTFVRPIRSLVALYGDEMLALTYGDVTSDQRIMGHRVLCPNGVTVQSADEYKEALFSANVKDQAARASAIEKEIVAYEETHDVTVERPKASFDEVVNLCEWPSVIEAEFDEEFLAVPKEIISDSLLSHQRYFPVHTKDGVLTRKFIVVSNADPTQNEQVREGNERVVRARLEDARFFYEQDLKAGTEELSRKLSQVNFHKKLGSVAHKAARIRELSGKIVALLGANDAQIEAAKRAGELAKVDLVSQTVIEFTNQQGVMGGYFATAEGETPEVAQAISTQYYPRFAGDALPEGIVSTAVSLADKIDTLAGLFGVSEIPTGSRDPFAVRRQSIGILAMIEAYPAFDLAKALAYAFDLYTQDGLNFSRDEAYNELVRYFKKRLDQMAKERGIAADIIQAVSGSTLNTSDFFSRADALQSARAHNPELFTHLCESYARAAHLSDTSLGLAQSEKTYTASQKALYEALCEAESTISKQLSEHAYSEALTTLEKLKAPIDTFFETTLVMDENLEVREQNLKLLNSLTHLFNQICNFDALAKGQNDAK